MKAGEEVRVAAQLGGSFLVEKGGRLAGWAPAEKLLIAQYENVYPEKTERPLPASAVSEARYEVTVADYRFEAKVPGLPDAENGYMAFRVSVKSLAQHSALPLRPSYFWIDQGGGRVAKALDLPKPPPDALPATQNLAIGAQTEGWIYAPRHPAGRPFAVSFQYASNVPPAHILLSPALGPVDAAKPAGKTE
jgi:hypothetical protein